MISKETFCSVLKKLEEQDAKEAAIINALDDYMSSDGLEIPDNLYRSAIFEMLNDEFGLDKSDDFIEMWVFDAIYKAVTLKVNGKDVDFSIESAEDFYDYLTENYDNLSEWVGEKPWEYDYIFDKSTGKLIVTKKSNV